jgi:Mrp family chromosome partitioning ATPase
MSHELGIAPAPGILDYLQRECAVEDALRDTDFPHLSVMPSGENRADFSVLIRTPRMRHLMAQLREQFDLIIMDMPSVLTNTDIQVLAKLTDRILLVVRSGVTPSKLVRQAVNEIGRERLAGAVLNAFQPDLPIWLDQRL